MKLFESFEQFSVLNYVFKNSLWRTDNPGIRMEAGRPGGRLQTLNLV